MKKLVLIIASISLSLATIAQQSTETKLLKHQSDSLYAIGVDLHKAGKYSEAIPIFSEVHWLDTLIHEEGHVIRDYATNWLANCYYKLGDTISAAEISDMYKAEQIDRRLTVEIDSIFELGKYYEAIGEIENALSAYQQSLEQVKHLFGNENYKVIECLNFIAIVYYYLEDINNMLNTSLEALEMTKKILGKKNELYIANLNSIASVYSITGNYKGAIKMFDELIEVGAIFYGETSPEYATILNNISTVYVDLGLFEKYKETLDIVLKIYTDNNITDERYGNLLTNYSATYNDIQDYNNSLKYQILAKENIKNNLGISHPTYTTNLSDLILTYNHLGKYREAQQIVDSILEINKKYNRELSSATCANIAGLYSAIGNNEKRLEYNLLAYNQAIKTKGEKSYNALLSLNNIGITYADLKDSTNALKYLRLAQEIISENMGENNHLYAATLNNSATVYYDFGKYDKALEYAKRSNLIITKIYGKDNINYFHSLDVGSIYSSMGQNDSALYYFQKVYDGYKSLLKETDYTYIFHLISFGNHYFKNNNYKSAIQYQSEATHLIKKNLISNLSFLTAGERELYWNKYKDGYKSIFASANCLPSDTSATSACFDAELIQKGLLLNSEIEFSKLILESGDSSLLADFDKMKLLRLQLDKQYEKPTEERTLNCDSLENVADRLEKKLVDNCKEYGDFTRSIALNWHDIQNALGKKDLAIEFTSFKITDNNDTTMYAALVLDKNMSAPVMIPLFTNFDLDKVMQNPDSEVVATETQSDDERGAVAVSHRRSKKTIYETPALYKLVWKPLAEYLDNSERVFFAPSGKLYQIAIEYLPADDKTNISEKYELYRLSTTKNLAMDYATKPYKSSTLYGGIKYDTDTTQMKTESYRYATRLAMAGGSFDSRTAYKFENENDTTTTRSVRNDLAYLPGTKSEVDAIKTQLAKKKIGVELFDGATANEESFKALSESKIDILHVATHGFFLEEEEGDSPLVNSLDRAGLLLSGSNLAWTEQPIPEGIEDGILTAREISYLDLRGVDLLVLSACQTALGEITGEGVFGLQRGFKKAGVRTIIMSLWSVDDAATQLMMTEFYKHLTKGKSKREAFLLAQKTVKTTKGFEKPYYWAAFVLLDGE